MKKEIFRKREKMKKGSIAVSQIIILVVSLIAFSYFIGSEFRVVSAADVCTRNNDGAPVKVTGINVNTQSQVNTWCVANGGSAVCNGGSGAWTLRITSCTTLPPTPQLQNTPGKYTPSLPSTISTVASTVDTGLRLKSAIDAKKAKDLAAGLTSDQFTNVADASKTGLFAKLGGSGSRWFGGSTKIGLQAIGKNFVWAAVIYFGSNMILRAFGVDNQLANSISASLAAGYMGATTYAVLKGGFAAGSVGGPLGMVIGAAIAVAVFVFTGETKKVNVVTFSCNPWSAPVGGKDCEKCNTGDFPCTAYKCQSLGQACNLENKGTTEELCVWKDRSVKPPVIKPWSDVLTTGYNYNPDGTISPPDTGVKIIPGTNVTGCIAPFTPITFGVMLDKPGKCKIETSNKGNFSSMRYFFGGSSTLKYNHTMRLPGFLSNESLFAENASMANGGRVTLYTRCQSANGYSNVANFIFNFCVDQGPDRTPPRIVTTSVLNGMPISYGTKSVPLQVYVNEPSECRWSHLDRSYDDMGSDNNMSCVTGSTDFNAQLLYQCSTTLTGLVDRVDNNFYFRCKDQPHLKNTNRSGERNANTVSYKFVLKGTQPLVIDAAGPNNTVIRDSTNVIKVTLTAKTSAGFNAGDATCSYKNMATPTGEMIGFFNTGTFNHSQELWLPEANYSFYIECVDFGNNADNKTINFRVESDTAAPVVGRVFRQENKLKIITNEEAQCVYGNVNCDYELIDGTNMSKAVNGTEHSTAWDTNKVFYIKCADKYGNRPLPNQCNIIARPFDIPSVK